jgi:DoxX-like family/Alpha/beta hydrolase domain
MEGDITTGIKIILPIATNKDGSQITDPVRAEYILNTKAASTVDVTAPPAYSAVSTSNAGATLTRRVHQDDAKELLDNSQWAFADCSTTAFPGTPNPTKVCLNGGFDTNHIYELVYTAKNPTVTGIGFAATRDFNSFLRGHGQNGGTGAAPANPLGKSIDYTIIYGSSQSGRWIRTFLELGFNEGEDRSRVFDGAIPHKASNRGAFNIRFAQPTRLSGTQHTEKQFPGQESPQTWGDTSDPIAGIFAGQLDRCRKSDTCPRITATETDTEYWQALMALNTTDATGRRDFDIPSNVRIYHFAGTQHGGGDPLNRHWLGWGEPRLLPLPGWAAALLYWLGDFAGWLGWRPPMRSTARREIVRGAVGDPTAWMRVSGIVPKSLPAALAAHPASVQERWFSRIYFLKPVAFVVLSLFWLVTGLIALGPGYRAGVELMHEAGAGGLSGACVVAGAVADIVIGIAIALRRTARAGLYVAIAVSVFYAIAATAFTPQLWLEPLGALVKIAPIVVLTLVALAILEDR